jgi:hypothetical protein
MAGQLANTSPCDEVLLCFNLTVAQVFLNCFFYVGTLNETVGYGNRVAMFLHKASSLKADAAAEEFLFKSDVSGEGSLKRRQSFSSSSAPLQPLIIAQLTDVSVKNPANYMLVEGLTMQVVFYLAFHFESSLTLHGLFMRMTFSDSFCRPDSARARMSHFRSFRLRQVVVAARHRPAVARFKWIC